MQGLEVDADGNVNLFQYGSNMSAEHLRSRVIEHATAHAPQGVRREIHPVGPGRLHGWRFECDLYSANQSSLVADVCEGTEADEVWGVVYKLDRELVVRSDGARSVLDRIEGYRPERDPQNYEPRIIEIELNGAIVPAITYVGTEEARTRRRQEHAYAQVSPNYAHAVISGAAGADLPANYQKNLRQALSGEPGGGIPPMTSEVAGHDSAASDPAKVGGADGASKRAASDGTAAIGPLAWLKESVTSILALGIGGVALVLLILTFAAGSKSGTASVGAFGREKDVLQFVLPILGTVLGYYFGRVPAERRAEHAEQTASGAQRQNESMQRAAVTADTGRAAAELQAQNVRADAKATATRIQTALAGGAPRATLGARPEAAGQPDVAQALAEIQALQDRLNQ